MSESAPPAAGTAVEARHMAPELDAMARVGNAYGQALAGNKGAATMVGLWVAKELGLSPVAGLKIKVNERGEVILPAELYRALAHRNGFRVLMIDPSDTECTAALVVAETGEELGRSTVTFEQARRAGWVKPNGAWEKTPGRMLWARSSAYVVRDFAPGVALGFGIEGEDDYEPATTAPEPTVAEQHAHEEHEHAAQAEAERAEEAEWEPVAADDSYELTPDELGALDHEGDDADADLGPAGPADDIDWPGEAP